MTSTKPPRQKHPAPNYDSTTLQPRQPMIHHTVPATRCYHFFILGLWVQPGRQPGAPPCWRFSLADPNTSERYSFTTLAELDAFLAGWMDDQVMARDR